MGGFFGRQSSGRSRSKGSERPLPFRPLALKEENTVSRYESRDGAMEEGYRNVGSVDVVLFEDVEGGRLALLLSREAGVEVKSELVCSTD